MFTASYLHNGVLYSQEENVEFYDADGTEDPFGTKSSRIKTLIRTEAKRSDLVVFLGSMSATEIQAAYPDLPDAETSYPVDLALDGSPISQGFALQEAPCSAGIEVTSPGQTIGDGSPQTRPDVAANIVVVHSAASPCTNMET